MSTLIGVLVDVSGSMRESIGERRSVNGKDTSWARSTFALVDKLIRHDVSYSNKVFAVAFGANNDSISPFNQNFVSDDDASLFDLPDTRENCQDQSPEVFDLLNTVKKFQPPEEVCSRTKRDIIGKAIQIMKSNGAYYVDRWASMEVLDNNISHQMACFIYCQLTKSERFCHYVVHECLPEVCRQTNESMQSAFVKFDWINLGIEIGKSGLSRVSSVSGGLATPEKIREVVGKIKNFPFKLEPVSIKTVMNVNQASEIMRGYTNKEELTDERIDELMDTVEPYIYGGTPLIQAMNEACSLFSNQDYIDKTKLLFILSDGMPGDGSNPPKQKLAELGVKVISCFITAENISDPKHLYSDECPQWSQPAKFMFDMSSTIPTELLPRTIFVKRDWKIETTNNETRLFMQINHPDIIEDVSTFARDVVCCKDALADVLANVSLDLYINKANKNFDAKKQEGGTCYANASAAVLHLAMQRIVGRKGDYPQADYPDFFDLRKEMIEKHGHHGANTLKVLEEMCPQYRLHVRQVDLHGALKAISRKRPVVARFRLTDEEWGAFSDFYRRKPKGIITKKEIDITQRPEDALLMGHAVVLTSYNSEGLQFMNSWGTGWANNGFFRVQSSEVLDFEFMDVYWKLSDLKHSEKMAFKDQGPNIAAKLVQSLKGLQLAEYECPICHKSSKVTDFEGSLTNARCPECEEIFDTKEKGSMLALNMYLLSMSG